ncbi:NPCBM/NEW2 domain-containing protein [Streptomyces sp. B1866]|uniref:NPCBM/NEW2 domain-containing protein n=1 Tax=Streptomyces sp. B1866 TaxID=3075431 RepID=UPI00288FDA04|nr:NPCBM/NEW2 domain-containing protein [Streptomyces sp. B1866]MDT3400439.1 NPCBM/NEW2 domain-containing protein [Streptomyces sp. B1866]
MPPAPAVFPIDELDYSGFGNGTKPEVRSGANGWLWQRDRVSVGGRAYEHGATVFGKSSVTIDLNRSCTAYDGVVGVDDLSGGLGAVRFAVDGDGTRLWRSPVVRGGDPAVPVHVPLAGRKEIRLVVEAQDAVSAVVLADWARSVITCD